MPHSTQLALAALLTCAAWSAPPRCPEGEQASACGEVGPEEAEGQALLQFQASEEVELPRAAQASEHPPPPVGDKDKDIPDMWETVKISFAHAEPVFGDLSTAMRKACSFIRAAGAGGVDLLVFSEGWLPGVPGGSHECQRLVQSQGLELSGLRRLQRCTKQAGVNVVMPIAEKNGSSLFSSAVFIDKAGHIAATHRKHLTSYDELSKNKVWWDDGAGTDYAVVELQGVGRVCALLGVESYLTLARYTLLAQGCEFLLAPTQEVSHVWDRHISNMGREGKLWIIGVGSLLSYSTAQGLGEPQLVAALERESKPPAGSTWLRDGGSCIVQPDGEWVVGPVHSNIVGTQCKGCTILPVKGYDETECAVSLPATRKAVLANKLYQDLVGNYLRSDIWDITWHNNPSSPYGQHSSQQCESDPRRKVKVGAARLPDLQQPVKIAFGQLEPMHWDLQASLKQICAFVAAAGSKGADLITFGEVIVPGYPWWNYWSHTFDLATNQEIYYNYARNLPQIGTGDLDPLFKCVAKAQVNVVLPMAERDNLGSQAVIMNSAVFIDKRGKLLARHRKNLPSHTERFWWGNGDGTDYVVVDMPDVGRVCALLCWETYVQLARYTLLQKGCEFMMMTTADFGGVWDHHASSVAREGSWYTIALGHLFAPYGKRITDTNISLVKGHFSNNWTKFMQADFDTIRKKTNRTNIKYFHDGGGSISRPDGEYLVSPAHSNEAPTVEAVKQGCKQDWDKDPDATHCIHVPVPGYNENEEFVAIATATRAAVHQQRKKPESVGNELCSDVWSVSWVDKPRGILFQDLHGKPVLADNGLPELKR